MFVLNQHAFLDLHFAHGGVDRGEVNTIREGVDFLHSLDIRNVAGLLKQPLDFPAGGFCAFLDAFDCPTEIK